MDLLETFNLAISKGPLHARVCAAALKAAYDIRYEDPAILNHTNRIVWSNQVLSDFETKGNEMYLSALANATIRAAGENATDNDIQFVVNGLVDQFAKG